MVSKSRLLTRIHAKAAAAAALSRSERRQLRKAAGGAPQPGYQVEGRRGKERASQRARAKVARYSVGGK